LFPSYEWKPIFYGRNELECATRVHEKQSAYEHPEMHDNIGGCVRCRRLCTYMLEIDKTEVYENKQSPNNESHVAADATTTVLE